MKYIDITVVGTDCSNGIKLLKMVSKTMKIVEETINIRVNNSLKVKSKYGITNVPGLIINNKLVSEGKVLSVREIKKLLLN